MIVFWNFFFMVLNHAIDSGFSEKQLSGNFLEIQTEAPPFFSRPESAFEENSHMNYIYVIFKIIWSEI